MVIKNLPDYARYHRYIVYRKCNGENWFWGAFDDEIKALNAAETKVEAPAAPVAPAAPETEKTK